MPNPVPRVRHPDWLHKKILEKTDNFKQRRLTDMFSKINKNKNDNVIVNSVIPEIQNDVSENKSKPSVPTITKRKRGVDECLFSEAELDKTWRDVLGNPPAMGQTKVSLKLLQIPLNGKIYIFKYN